MAPLPVIAWLAALSSLFEYLCDKNAVTRNPVKGIKRRSVEGYQGKPPAIGDHQARGLLEAPNNASVKGKRDSAILATLLYHALRREELCKLRVKAFKHERRGFPISRFPAREEKRAISRSIPPRVALFLIIWKHWVMVWIWLAPSSGLFATTAQVH